MSTNLKKSISIAIALIMMVGVVCSFPLGVDASTEAQKSNATRLFNMKVLLGSDGTHETMLGELDNTTSREEAAVMLVRLLGAESEAKAANDSNPFTDAQKWQKPYVSWLYKNGLTKGVSATRYGSSEKIDFKSYCTYMNRTLGYTEDAGDFQWSNAHTFFKDLVTKTYDISILNTTLSEVNKYWNQPTAKITRGDLVNLTTLALETQMKDSDMTLKEYLISKGVFTEGQTAWGVNPGEKTQETKDLEKKLSDIWGENIVLPDQPNYDGDGYDPNLVFTRDIDIFDSNGGLYIGAYAKYSSITTAREYKNNQPVPAHSIKVNDPDCIVVYTRDYSTPSLANGTQVTQADGEVLVYLDKNWHTSKIKGFVNGEEVFTRYFTDHFLKFWDQLPSSARKYPGLQNGLIWWE